MYDKMVNGKRFLYEFRDKVDYKVHGEWIKMMIIGDRLLDEVSSQAKESSRLRMNYNFHKSLDEKCHRFLNAVEPGTKVEIHRHPTKDESFVLLRGKVRVNTYNDDGTVLESVILCPEEGLYGVDIPKNA